MRALHRLLALCCVAQLVACAAPQSTPAAASASTAPAAEPVVPGGEGKLPGYRRLDKLQGTVQLSGSSAVATFARAWGSAFQRVYPSASVNVVSKSSGAAVGDMAANPAVIGMMSRAMTASERDGYVKQFGQPPLEFKVAIDAVAIFVFKDNPLKSISLAQLERIYAAAPKSGATIDRWEQIGLDGD